VALGRTSEENLLAGLSGQDDLPTPRLAGRRRLAALAAALTVGMLALGTACGFGPDSDTGAAVPGQWWPWVCPDGGTPQPDAGCPVSDADGGP